MIENIFPLLSPQEGQRLRLEDAGVSYLVDNKGNVLTIFYEDALIIYPDGEPQQVWSENDFCDWNFSQEVKPHDQ